MLKQPSADEEKSQFNSVMIKDVSIESIKNDMIKMKKLLTFLGLLPAIFLVTSLAAAAIAALAYTETTIQKHDQSETSQIQAFQTGQGVNYSTIVDIVSTEMYRILNESAPAEDLLNRMIMNNFSALSSKLFAQILP